MWHSLGFVPILQNNFWLLLGVYLSQEKKKRKQYQCFLLNFANSSFTVRGRWILEKYQNNLVDNQAIFFGAEGCGTCGAPCLVLAQLSSWTRPPPHSPLQIQNPHPLCETLVGALKSPSCLLQRGCPCPVPSVLCGTSSGGWLHAPGFFPEATRFESMCWMSRMGIPDDSCHHLRTYRKEKVNNRTSDQH